MDNVVKSVLLSGVVLLVLLIVVKLLFGSFDLGELEDKKTLTSVGTAEIVVQPDQAEVYTRVEVLRDTASLAETESKKISDAVLSSLQSFSGATVETTSYNLYKKEDWTDKGSIFKGYVASYALKVSTSDLHSVGSIVDTLVTAGVTTIDSVQFTLSTDKRTSVKNDAYVQAGKQAEEKARSIVQGVGMSLGDVVQVTESDVSYPPVYYAKEAVADSVSSPLSFEPQSLRVTATVTVVYGLE